MSTEAQPETMSDDERNLPLDEAGDITLPLVEVLTGRGFITGKSGSGKSNTASVVIEELLSRSRPVLIVDTDGEYWGLKEQFEVLHVGADEECDLQVGPEHAEKLADLALEQGVPIILDVSGYLDEDDANALVRETASALFAKEKKLRRPFLMLVEEVHEYIPEGGGLDDVGQMLIKIGKRGRKHGLGLCGISQRPADVKKDFITQCDWLMWHRLTWDNDTKVVGRVVGSDQADAVQDLGDGEAFLQADFLDEDVLRVQVRRKHTYDAGATPDLEEFERPELKSVSGDLVGELEEISQREERRRDRISELEGELESREERIDALEEDLERAKDMTDMAEQFSQALMSSGGGESGEVLEQRVEEIQEEKNAELRALRSEKSDLEDELKDVREERAELKERVDDLEERAAAAENMDELREAVARMAEILDVGDENDEALRRKLKRARERIDELESRDVSEDVTAPDGYDVFVEDEYVREAIEDAKQVESVSPRYVKGTVAGILRTGGPVSRRTVADDLGIQDASNIGKAMRALEARNLVVLDGSGDEQTADFAFDEVEAIHEQQARQRRTEEVMEKL